MDTTIDLQVAMDEALVPHAKRLRIRRSNFRILSDIKSKESTLQLVYDVLRITLFFKAFLVTGDVLEIYMHAAIRTLTDVNINKLYQPWGSFAAIINKCLTGKSSSYDSLRLSQTQILWGLYHKRNVDYAYLMWEDFVYQVKHKDHKKSNEMYYPRFTKVIIYHFMSKDPSIPRRNKFGALLPIELTNEEIRNFNAYKEYYAVAIGAAPPKPKVSIRKTRSSSDTTITPPTTTADEGSCSIPGVPDVPTDESEEELSWNSTEDEGKDGDGDDDDNGDDGEEGDGDDDDDDQEVERDDDKDDEEEGNGKEDLGLNVGREKGHDEEEEEDELYRDVNINQGRGIQETLEVKDSHVTLTPVNPDVHVAIQLQSDKLRKEAQKENDEFLKTIDENMQKIIKEQVKEQVKLQVSKILPRIEQTVNEQLEYEVLTRSSHSLKTSYDVAVDLSEMELKKILIEKMEGNMSIQRSDEQRNLYKALASASESATAEEPMQTTFQMEEPSHPEFDAGAEDQPIVQSSQYPEWFSQQQKPPTLDRDWNTTLQATHESIQPWISELAKLSDSRSSFNKLMDTPLDFSNFLINQLKVDTLTPKLIAGPTYELLKGSCKSLQYPHNLLKPLPLIPNIRGRRVIPFDHFINNDLEYLHGGASSRKYTTSVTKTKAADYEHIKDDDKLYKFKEGDFKRLRIQDIEDMLLLLVQGKLTNLTAEERFAFNVSLRMFTRSIVIQRRVEDLQLIILTKAGNPVKKILLKLNLSDHRKLKDGGKGTWFQLSHGFITTCSYPTLKYKDIIFQDFCYSDTVDSNNLLDRVSSCSSLFSLSKRLKADSMNFNPMHKMGLNMLLNIIILDYNALCPIHAKSCSRSEGKLAHLEQPLIPIPLPVAPQAVRDTYEVLYDAQNEVACLMLGIKASYASKQEDGQSVSAYILKMKGYLDTLKCLGYVMPKEVGMSFILNSLNKDYDQFVQNYNMHNMGKSIVELHAILKLHEKGISKKAETLTILAIWEGKIHKERKNPKGEKGKDTKKNKLAYDPKPKIPPPPKREHPTKEPPLQGGGSLEEEFFGLSESKKLKHGALSLCVENGMHATIEAIGNFDLILPETKESKYLLDSCYLWYCRLSHINKKRMDKLQCDKVLQLTHDVSLEKSKSCIFGKMIGKSFPHQVERTKDLLGLIYTDVYGPFRIMSREGASYFITFTDDFSRYGYVYLMKHKHEGYVLESAVRILNMALTHKVERTPYEISYEKAPNEEHNEIAPIVVEPQNVEVPIRISIRIPQAPDRYGFYVDVEEYELEDLDEPPNYKVVLSDPDQSAYLEKTLKKFRMENSKKGYTPMIEKPNYRKSQGAKTHSEVQRMRRVPYALAIEAEYIVIAEASMEAVWMRKFIDGLGNFVPSNKRPMEMYVTMCLQ
nr:hypothetical protein [Tanacetum cinerariifolium]